MVGKSGACRLHVAHARELKLEVDAVGLALGLELGDLAAKLLGRLGVLGRLGNLGLERRDLLVALGDSLLPVGAAHLWLFLRRLLPPEVFLGLRVLRLLDAMVITCHVGHLSSHGRQSSSAP